MKVKSSRSGFSLVELLTVIAIIAILAAIIFPVMARVKESARQNQCMTNLHQIGIAVQMFKQDNRRYPSILCGPAIAGEPIERANGKDGQLFGEYVKGGAKIFHCPSSQVQKGTDYADYTLPSAAAVRAYTYDSYDCYVQGAFPNYTIVEPHYVTNWAPSISEVGDWMAYPPDNSAAQSDLAIAKEDYERQLRWRTPPGDTVITWCSYHETRSTPDSPANRKGKSLVLFLDGSADSMPASEVGQCQWRARPKKS